MTSPEQCIAIARMVLEHSGRPYTEQRLAELADFTERLGVMPDLSPAQRSRLAVLLRPMRESAEVAA